MSYFFFTKGYAISVAHASDVRVVMANMNVYKSVFK